MIPRLLAASLIAFVLLTVVFYVFQEVYVGRGVLVYAITIGLVVMLIVRVGSVPLGNVTAMSRKVLLLGAVDDIERLRQLVSLDPRFHGVRIAATFAVMPEAQAVSLGMRREEGALMKVVGDYGIDDIVIAARDRRGGVLPLRELLNCKLAGVRVLDGESFCERQLGLVPLHNLRASWLLAGDGFSVGWYRDAVKRVVDLAVSGLLLVLTLPVLAITAILIKLDSPGPVIYRQSRVGYNRHTFSIYKLRSMRSDSEADGKAQWAKVGDARVTRVGKVIRKLRIDELPQLLNVLKGEMSFVGPRPERPEFVAELVKSIPFYDVRHSVKPGITGWSQVRYPYGASIEDSRAKLQYDLYYVKNHSLFLDLVIILETMQVVLYSKGAR